MSDAPRTSPPRTATPDCVVAIAASAGGVQALLELLSGLPHDLAASVVIVQHTSESDAPTRLPEILNARSALEVRMAADGGNIESGRAFLAPPGRHLVVEGHRLRLHDGPPVNHVRPSADVLFASVASQFEPRVIGIVLSGTGRDGAAGSAAIRAAGGTTIAQDEESSTFFEMPGAAIAAGGIDRVLPLHEIPDAVVRLVQGRPPAHDPSQAPPPARGVYNGGIP